jgi:hypothetical protein
MRYARTTLIVLAFLVLSPVARASAEETCHRDDAIALADDLLQGTSDCSCPQVDCRQRRITIAGCSVSCSNGQEAQCNCANPDVCNNSSPPRQTCACRR